MDKYTIYCTEDQTKKALELGAPIESYPLIMSPYGVPKYERQLPSDKWIAYILPTTEQMIGWLEEQGQSIEVSRLYRNNQKWSAFVDDTQIVGKYYPTRKEAILDAIDTALEYLENKQQ